MTPAEAKELFGKPEAERKFATVKANLQPTEGVREASERLDDSPGEVGSIDPKPTSTDRDPDALPDVVWRGAFGSYRAALANSTEAADALHFGVFATIVGLIVGRRAYIRYARFTFPNSFACLIGMTGKGRKTTAIRYGLDAYREVVKEPCTLATASWEGLLDLLAEEDSRQVLLIPGEFRTLAAKARQESSSILIPGLTEAYDCPPELRHKTRGKDTAAVRPFVSALTASTREWFRESFDENAVHGGFLNRWIFLDGTPKAPIPFPDPPDAEHWRATVDALRAMDGRLRMYPETTGLQLDLSPEARDLWADFYTKALEWDHKSELLAKMAERLPDHTLKLALLYALLEDTERIEADQLSAAIEFARWERGAHERVFEGFGDSKQKRLEDRLLRALERFHDNGQKPTVRKLQGRIGGGVSADEFNRALRALERADRLTVDHETRCVGLVGRCWQ